MGVSSRNLLLYVLLVALLHHGNHLWTLWVSMDDITTAKELSDLPMVGGITVGRTSDERLVKKEAAEIENAVQGSFFSFSVFGMANTEDASDERIEESGEKSFPSLAQIDQATVTVKRGTRVYLDYLHPSRKPLRDEFTVAIAATIPDLRSLFGQGRPPWAGPISCAIQISKIAEDVAAISDIVNANPAAFEHTSIHLLLSEAMVVVDWSTVWNVALKGAESDLVMALPEPVSSLLAQLDNAADTVKEHYAIKLQLEKSIIRIKKPGAVILSKRAGLLPMLETEIKTKEGIIDAWIKQLEKLDFTVRPMSWAEFFSTDDTVHSSKSNNGLLEMGSMYVVKLATVLKGSVAVNQNLNAFTNFITPRYAPNPDEVCVVTQMAFNKRERLVKLATAWGGVLSVSVFLKLTEVEALVRFVRNNHMAFSYTYIHIVLYNREVDFYPINTMRNVATDAAATDFIFTVDLDFMPSLASHNVIREYISHPFWGNQLRAQRHAWIIPAFEYTVSDMTDAALFGSLPLTKAELVRSKDAIPFHINWYFKGHKPTDFERWYKTEEPYEVRWEQGFEPYVVLCKNKLIPSYWQGFKGYKENKLSWISELNEAGWSFYVLPGEAFVIHMYHDISNRPEMPTLKKEKRKFQAHLKETYAAG